MIPIKGTHARHKRQTIFVVTVLYVKIVSFKLQILFLIKTRDAFPVTKIRKEGSQKYYIIIIRRPNPISVILKNLSMHGRSPDQENVRQCFLQGNLGWLLLEEI